MKKFKFRYESILNQRLDEEKKIKNYLAQAIGESQRLKKEFSNLEQKEKKYLEFIGSELSKGFVGSQCKSYSQGKTFYREKKNFLLKRIAQADQKIEKIKINLSEAMKKRKTMEKLKEKAFEQYVESINQAEQKLIEEIVNYKNSKRDEV